MENENNILLKYIKNSMVHRWIGSILNSLANISCYFTKKKFEWQNLLKFKNEV